MEEVLNNVSEQTNVADNSSNYIEAIKEMKANTVDKQAYLKLKEENKQLLNSIVNGQSLEQAPVKEEPVVPVTEELPEIELPKITETFFSLSVENSMTCSPIN